MKRNSKQNSCSSQRGAVWCEASVRVCRTHRRASAVNFISGRRELPLQSEDVIASEGILRDEEEWYRGNINNAFYVFVSLTDKETRTFFCW